MKLSRLFLLSILLLTACAPGARTFSEITSSPEAQQLGATAQLAYHKMEAAKLETGTYNTNVLADLALPQGVLWQLESLSNEGYQLRFVSSDVPGFAYLVDPSGVKLVPAG
jgi:hypothetical protein